MSKGPLLTEFEIARACKLYASGLTWRCVGERLGRDHSGLRRACGGGRSNIEAQRLRQRGLSTSHPLANSYPQEQA